MKKSVLVADHAQAYLMHISSILQRMGFDVIPVAKSLDIIKAVRKKTPDLIIFDEDISKDHSMDILDWLGKNKSTSRVQVVLMSSKPRTEMKNQCHLHGCADYIRKPISLRRLHKILEDNIYSPLGYSRKHLRALFYGQATLIIGGKSKEFTCESLSEGGIYVVTDKPLPVGTALKVRLDLEHGNFLTVDGVVIYINTFQAGNDDTPKGMAIEFKGLGKDEKLVISDYVQGLLTIPTYMPV